MVIHLYIISTQLTGWAKPMALETRDQFNRAFQDLRISVTDKCNFRCTYCMPKEVYGRNFRFLDKRELLSFDEICRLARIFRKLGVRKLRITGGEPLLRKQIELLIEKLSRIGFADLTLTTNAAILKKKARALKDSGLDRITVSLDSLNDKVFRAMNDVDFPVARVLAGIEEADKVGLNPIKINMVVKRGVNENNVLEMCDYFRGSGHILRFIEFMDVGTTNGWNLGEVIPSIELIGKINESYKIKPLDANYKGEVAERWIYEDGKGEIGFISSVTQAFCDSCTRGRLSAEGKLYTCLFASRGFDLRELIRSDASDSKIATKISEIWGRRKDRYSELRTLNTTTSAKVEMSYIGG